MSMHDLILTLKDWQTLLAGLIAIGAAFIGGGYINRQISASEAAENDRRKRKFAAARAVLPLTLSALSDYSQMTIEALKLILATRQDHAIPKRRDPMDFPRIPPSVIADLRDMIEFSDEPITKEISTLLVVLQIQIARLISLNNHLSEKSETLVAATNVERYIIQTAEIYARCGQLFNFARGELDFIPTSVSRKSIHSALNQSGLWSDRFPSIHALVESSDYTDR